MLVARTLVIMRTAYAGGGSFILENPVDRGAGAHFQERWRSHAPLWLLGMVADFIAETGAVKVDVPLCALGSPYQKWTTFAVSPDLAWLADMLGSLKCEHEWHESVAIGFDEETGEAASAPAAAYPSPCCRLFAIAAAGTQNQTAQEPATPPPAMTTVAVHQAGTYTLAFLFFITPDGAMVAVPPAAGELFGTRLDTAPTRDASLYLARDLMRALASDPELQAEMAAVRRVPVVGGDAVLRIHFGGVIAPRDPEPGWRPHTSARVTWIPPDGAARGLPGELAHAVCLAIGNRLEPGPALPAELEIGVGGERAALTDLRPAAATASFESRLAAAHAAERELTAAILAVDVQGPARTFLRDCAERVCSPPVAEIPEALRRESRSFDLAELAMRPFPRTTSIPTSEPLVRLPAPNQDTDVPDGDEDFWTADFISRYTTFRAQYNAYHRARMRGDPMPRPCAFAYDHTAVRPRWRGGYYDFRGGKGHVTRLDPSALAYEPHIDSTEIHSVLARSGDLEAADHWAGGMSFKANMPLWVVIHPNLLNFWDGLLPATVELDAFRKRGWMRGVDASLPVEARCLLPSYPFYAQPRGAVAKKAGTAPRIIIDMGAPRKPCRTWHAADGQPARQLDLSPPSLNESAGPMREPKWPRETKPTAADAAGASAILMSAAEPAGVPVFEVEIDFWKFFHQWPYCNESACVDGAMTPLLLADGTVGDELVPENCHVMAMGGSPCSGLAQRGSNSNNHGLLRRMDSAEAELLPLEPDSVQQWVQRRRAIPHDSFGSHARLVDVSTYSDDPRAAVVGVRRAVRLLLEIFDLFVRRQRLVLSGPEKWSIGSSGLWVGVHFSAMLGIVWISREKALKLIDAAQSAIAGELSAGDWRAMLGFLEHVWGVLHRHRYTLDKLWEPCQQGGTLLTLGPAALVPPTREQQRLLRRVMHAAANVPGASMLAVVRPDAPPVGTTRWLLIGDAAREDGDLAAGLGGTLYGLWSYLPLSQEMFDAFDTPHLEFIQCGMLCITHTGRLSMARWVELAADALATPNALAAGARSRLMRAILSVLLAQEGYRAYLEPHLRITARQRW